MKMFKWKKLGLVFNPTNYKNNNWLNEFAQAPSVLEYDDFIRVYFSCRPKANEQGQYVSYSSYVDLNKNNFKYPKFNLGAYLSRKRLFFGEAIQFQGADKKNSFGKILSIKEYGSETAPIMLDPLLNLDCEFLQTHCFYLEPQEKVQKLIHRQKVRLENSNDPARSQIHELSQLQDDLASGKVKTGFYHHSLLLIAPALDKLDQAITEAVKKYSQAGLVAVEETLGLEPTFWAQMPTNASYIVRAQPITSANFVDFCPLHNYSMYQADQGHLLANHTMCFVHQS